jgi:heat-inducible transcriptional repressor
MTDSYRSSPRSELNERAQHLLRTLIERYIRDGQPVGSRTLARDAGLDLSPATVRNVMADLEEMGYLRAPHTSAGRVPTVRGYRFFVDTLLQAKPPRQQEVETLWQQLDRHQSTGNLLQAVSTLLSGLTHLAGIVTVPRREALILRHVEFLPLSDNRVLVILVVNEQEVQNRIIQTQRTYSATELQQAANYLNAEFAGRGLDQVRGQLLQDLRQARETLNNSLQAVVEMADQMFQPPPPSDDYVLAGQTNLMAIADLANVERLRQLFEAFNHKRDILHLFDQCMQAEGVQIFIGEEAGFDALDLCSVITAPYSVDGEVLGVLGIIGPTRMAYARVIPVVDITARLLTTALNSRQ